MSDSINSNGHGPAELDVTPASEFRRVRELGERITIPSTGRVVRMRVVKTATLLRLGKIPDPLSEIVIARLYGQMTKEQYDAYFEVKERKEHAADMLESLRVVCTAALVRPRIVDVPEGDDEIHIDDLEDGEQRYIFDLALLEATDLSRFRIQQEERLESLAQGAGVEVQTEPTGGDSG